MEDLSKTLLNFMTMQAEQQKADREQQKADRELLREQLQRSEERQQKFFREMKEDSERRQHMSEERVLQALGNASLFSESESSFSQTAIWNTLEVFTYAPEEDKTFEVYFRRYEDLFKIDCENWSDTKKVRLLLSKLGSLEHGKFVDFILPKKTRELAFEQTVKLLQELFSPRTSLFHKRWKCFNTTKIDQEDFLTYAACVNKSCDDFKLSELTADNFKCLIFAQGLISSKSAEIRRRVLSKLENEPTLTLQQLAEDCQRFMNVKTDSKKIEESGVAHVRKIRKETRQHTPHKELKKPPKYNCFRCGGKHWQNDCKYATLRLTCNTCGKVGHKGSHCPNKLRKARIQNTSSSHTDEDNTRKYVTVKINKQNVKMQLDSGSDLSIINVQTWKKINKPTVSRTRRLAKTVTGEKINFEGEILVSVSFRGRTIQLPVFIVKESANLFGTDWFGKFQLWDVPINNICNQVTSAQPEAETMICSLKKHFPNVFSPGLGKCTKLKAKFQLKKNATPVFRRKRNVPFASQEHIEKELDRLVENDILTKVEHSEWAAPVVYVKKKSREIRMCADFSTGLNDALEDYCYPLPTPEDIFSKLNGGKLFTKIDLSDAYLQVPVDDSCSDLLCINSHRGLFKFNRLAFGVKVAPAIFQHIMDTMLQNLDFAAAYLDDIIIVSKTEDEHRNHVHAVFERISEFGFKVKESKCTFFMSEIRYLGHIINKDGRKPDPERAEAIKNMPPPQNVLQLQSFLGLANFYQVFIPDMHNLRAPLNLLLKKDQKWDWSTECQSAFQKIKDVLLSDLYLTHYDSNKEIVVASDASSHGIGACILHKMSDGKLKPVAHASRSLLPAERNYSQIEKEALAIIFAVTKFHRYIHGRSFILQTDHKPLISIYGSKKGLPAHTANRLLRWGTILLNYNFHLQYLTSKKIAHADGLSRLIPTKSDSFEETVIASIREDVEEKRVLCNTILELPVSLQEIKREAENDDFISSTKRHMQEKNQTVSNSFLIVDDVLMYNERIVIPSNLQARILRDFHKGHPGRSRMKALMRSFVYWSKMDSDIDAMVNACRGCALAAKAPPVVFKPWPKSELPWSRIHLDFAGPVDGVYYLIIVDSFSKWPEVIQCRKPTSEVVINFLFELFARFGVVDCIVTDNGTQFTSADFKHFCKLHLIDHITTPQYHPRSNGQAERFVDTLKRALKKAGGTPSDKALQQFLNVYRITPNSNVTAASSPAEAMFGRKIRSVFEKLIPQAKKWTITQPAPKRKYMPGEKVFFKAYKNNLAFWEAGVIERKVGSMIYEIQGPRHLHKRHINQLKKRSTECVEEEPPRVDPETPIDTFYECFDVQPPQPDPVNRRSGRKRRLSKPFLVDPKRKKY